MRQFWTFEYENACTRCLPILPRAILYACLIGKLLSEETWFFPEKRYLFYWKNKMQERKKKKNVRTNERVEATENDLKKKES